MPKVNYQLSGQRLSSGGANSKLSLGAGMVSSGAIGNIRPALISSGAGQVQYTPLDKQQIVVDNTLSEIAKTTGTFVAAAEEYADRQSSLWADEAVVAFQKQTREGFYGSVDAQGRAVPGYNSTKTSNATGSFGSYRDGVNGAFDAAVGGLDDRTKQKAMIRLSKVRDTALQEGANHSVKQMAAYKVEQQAIEIDELREGIRVKGGQAFTDGTIAMHVSKYETYKERVDALSNLGVFTVREKFNQTMAGGGTAAEAYNSTVAEYKTIRDTLPPLAQQNIEHWLNGQQKAAKALQKKNAKADLENAQYDVRERTPEMIAATLSLVPYNGGYPMASQQIVDIRNAHADQSKDTQSKVVMDALKGGLKGFATHGDFTKVGERIGAVAEKGQVYLDSLGDSISSAERDEAMVYLHVTLPDKLEGMQKGVDHAWMAKIGDSIRVEDGVEKFKNVEPPPSMLHENAKKWRGMQEAEIKAYAEGLSREKMVYSQGNEVLTEAIIIRGDTITKQQIETDVDKVVEGEMTLGNLSKRYQYQQLAKRPQGASKAPKYRKTGNFVNGMNRLRGLWEDGVYNEGPKPTDTKELRTWNMEADVRRGRAEIAFDKAYAKDPEGFNIDAWFEAYAAGGLNNGKVSNISRWIGFDAKEPYRHNVDEEPKAAEEDSVMSKIDKKIKKYIRELKPHG